MFIKQSEEMNEYTSFNKWRKLILINTHSRMHSYISALFLKITTLRSSNLILVMQVKSLSRVQLFETPWTVAYQAPPSMGFSRQGYWSGLPFPSPGDLPNPGIEPRSPEM